MTEYREFFKNTDQTNMDGDFDCFECDEYVERAFYDAAKKLITYKCSKGHVSKVEFNV